MTHLKSIRSGPFNQYFSMQFNWTRVINKSDNTWNAWQHIWSSHEQNFSLTSEITNTRLLLRWMSSSAGPIAKHSNYSVLSFLLWNTKAVKSVIFTSFTSLCLIPRMCCCTGFYSLVILSPVHYLINHHFRIFRFRKLNTRVTVRFYLPIQLTLFYT